MPADGEEGRADQKRDTPHRADTFSRPCAASRPASQGSAPPPRLNSADIRLTELNHANQRRRGAAWHSAAPRSVLVSVAPPTFPAWRYIAAFRATFLARPRSALPPQKNGADIRRTEQHRAYLRRRGPARLVVARHHTRAARLSAVRRGTAPYGAASRTVLRCRTADLSSVALIRDVQYKFARVAPDRSARRSSARIQSALPRPEPHHTAGQQSA